MKYMLIFHESPEAFASRHHEDEARSGAYWEGWGAFHKALEDAGVYTGVGAALQGPASATTVKIRDGQTQIQDGPFADSKEQFGGYMTIDVLNLDEALKWAARCPAASDGVVEVSPLLEMEKGCD